MGQFVLVLLRKPAPEDADQLYPQLAGTSVTDTLFWDGPSCRRELREGLAKHATGDPPGHAFFVIERRDTGQAIGCADVRKTDVPGVGGVGLWLGEAHQGLGLGSEAIALLVAEAARLGYQRVEARVFLGNLASRRAFEKNGFELQRVLTAAFEKRGRPIDEWLLERPILATSAATSRLD